MLHHSISLNVNIFIVPGSCTHLEKLEISFRTGTAVGLTESKMEVTERAPKQKMGYPMFLISGMAQTLGYIIVK